MSRKIQLLHGIREQGKKLFQPGNSAHAAKLRGEKTFGRSDFIIRSHKTYTTYWDIWMRFALWLREHDVNRWENLVENRDALASEWLVSQRDLPARTGTTRSAWTLKTYRAALRMLFCDPDIARSVNLPPRTCANIKRSRHTAKRDSDLSPLRYAPLIQFAAHVGPRRRELQNIEVRDVRCSDHGDPVAVFLGRNSASKGGKVRWVELITPDQRAAVSAALSAARDREPGRPEERLFERIPSHLDVHSLRRTAAHLMFAALYGEKFVVPPGRFRWENDRQRSVARQVGVWLGHGPHREDTVLRHYLK